jgi:hypothetical protein
MGRVTRAIAALLGRDNVGRLGGQADEAVCGTAHVQAMSLARGAEREPRASAGDTTPDPPTTRLALALIACLDLFEPDEEVAEQASAALEEAGVVAIDPDGDRFDRRLHRVQGRIDTDDPRQDWMVANTVQRGWVRGDTLLRPAQVWVYRNASDEGAPPGTDLP